MKNECIARFFYEQCAGSTTGHMAMIPNNPVLFGLIKSISGNNDKAYAATQSEFADMLRLMADDLDPADEQRKNRPTPPPTGGIG